jgi:uncharacterized membrane protein
MHYWFDGGHILWMTLSWVFIIGLFTTFLGLLVLGASHVLGSNESPEETLRGRYASGEIDTPEYESRLEELRKTKTAA